MFFAPVDIKYCAGIGNIVIQWGFLERSVDDFIELLLNKTNTIPKPNWRFHSHKDKAKVLKNLTKRCFQQFPRIIEEIDDIQSQASLFQIDRNLLAHGEMSQVFPAKGGVIWLQVKGGYNRKNYTRDYDLEKLANINSEIGQLHGRLAMLTSDTLDVDCLPGWSQQELSALQDLR